MSEPTNNPNTNNIGINNSDSTGFFSKNTSLRKKLLLGELITFGISLLLLGMFLLGGIGWDPIKILLTLAACYGVMQMACGVYLTNEMIRHHTLRADEQPVSAGWLLFAKMIVGIALAVSSILQLGVGGGNSGSDPASAGMEMSVASMEMGGAATSFLSNFAIIAGIACVAAVIGIAIYCVAQYLEKAEPNLGAVNTNVVDRDEVQKMGNGNNANNNKSSLMITSPGVVVTAGNNLIEMTDFANVNDRAKDKREHTEQSLVAF